jgi:hypothetical protein
MSKKVGHIFEIFLAFSECHNFELFGIVMFDIHFTPNTWAIRPSITRSKWNLDEIYGLKVAFIICRYATKIVLEISTVSSVVEI